MCLACIFLPIRRHPVPVCLCCWSQFRACCVVSEGRFSVSTSRGLSCRVGSVRGIQPALLFHFLAAHIGRSPYLPACPSIHQPALIRQLELSMDHKAMP